MAIGSKITIIFNSFQFPDGGVISFDTKADIGGGIISYIETGRIVHTPPFEFDSEFIGLTPFNFMNAFKVDYNGNVLDGDFLLSSSGTKTIIIESKLLDVTFENISVPSGVSVSIENIYPPIAIETGGRINARSPFIATAPIYNGVTEEVPTSAKFDIYIWEGLDTAVPLTPAYEVTKLPKFTGDNALYINTNKYILDYLIQNGTENKAVWVLINIATETESLVTIQSSSQYLALEGYNNRFDGLNYTTESPVVFDNNIIYVPEGEDFNLSLCVGYDATTINYYTGVAGDVLDDVVVLTAEDDTANVIFSDSTGALSQVTRVEIVVDAIVIKQYYIKYLPECKYTPIKCTFINRSGVLQDMWFFKSFKEQLKVKSKDYKSTSLSMIANGTTNYMTNDPTQHNTKTYNVDGSKKITLNTGFIDEDNNALIEQLLLSEDVWITKDGNFHPVNINKKSVEFQTKINDKLIKYSMDFNFSYNVNDKLV